MRKCSICKQPTGQEMLIKRSRQTIITHAGQEGISIQHKYVCEYCLDEHSQVDEETNGNFIIIEGHRYE